MPVKCAHTSIHDTQITGAARHGGVCTRPSGSFQHPHGAQMRIPVEYLCRQNCALIGSRSQLSLIPVLEFSLPVARTHARMLAALPKTLTAGAHDALIAATAVHYGHALLTRNVADFTIFAGLKIEAFSELH